MGSSLHACGRRLADVLMTRALGQSTKDAKRQICPTVTTRSLLLIPPALGS